MVTIPTACSSGGHCGFLTVDDRRILQSCSDSILFAKRKSREECICGILTLCILDLRELQQQISTRALCSSGQDWAPTGELCTDENHCQQRATEI